MKESVTYQAIKEEGREEGREKGREEGREEGAHFVALQMLSMKFGILPSETVAQIERLPLTQVPNLALAAQRFESVSDLTHWIQTQTS